MAAKVEVTAESMPPETPMTNPEVFEAFSIDLWCMCKFVHLSGLSLSCSICVAISRWRNCDTEFEGIPVLIRLNLCATLQCPGFYQNI